MTLLVVGLGGAAGAVSRYLTSGWVQGLSGSFFPWGTFAVNVCGSLALGFVMVWLQSIVTSPELRELVTIGFLGSFTTFSTFSYEALALLRDREWWQAGGYTIGSVFVGLLAVALGAAVAAALTRPRL
ncbi:MAG TPA: fluoride efflux transporter CrcB [Longimicrobiales bacterium]|nr:fluoride efflux transporter CrcB [Longimicrobiales bacterium]